MVEPYSTIPKIIPDNITDGFVMRYFIRHISRSDVLEIDKKQYDIFQRNSLYEVFSLKWFILGTEAISRNAISIEFYTNPSKAFTNISPKMISALKTRLRSPSEFVIVFPSTTPPERVQRPMPILQINNSGPIAGFVPPITGGPKQST